MLKGILAILISLICFVNIPAQTKDFTRHVNPFIGTGGHGHTFPGATMPFGMVQLSPDTRIDNWDGSSGYHYSDNTIYGFSHTHLSGTGIPDGCDILLMPEYDGPRFFRWPGEGSVTGSGSKFSHANEKAEPGYYSVRLDDGILAELTATNRVGFHRYTFPKSGTQSAGIVLNLKWRDKALDTQISAINSRRIEGFRQSSSWAKNQTVYFVAEFSKPFSEIGGYTHMTDDEAEHIRKFKRGLNFNSRNGTQVLVKVAISSVSIEGARKNLERELPGWDFEKVRADAKAAWNKELSKIEVSGGMPEQTTNFYTALYHTMIHPNVSNDIDGRYKGHDGKVHQLPGSTAGPADARRSSKADLDQRPVSSAKPSDVRRSSASPKDAGKLQSGYAVDLTDSGKRRHSRKVLGSEQRKSGAFPYIEGQSPNPKSKIQNPKLENQYTVFSLWDTFRAAHPLYTIIDQKRTVDFINTFIRQYEQGGRLPVWELWGEETDTMIGYHAVSVVADAMAKGIQGFDYEKAYKAAKHSAELDHFGLAAFKKRGYISMEDEQESVSKTLEYAYNDWCIAVMAVHLATIELTKFAKTGISKSPDYLADADKYLQRARYFENLFDTETGFFRPKQNGGFVNPFQPNEVTFHFTEGNSWQYSFFVPHDVTRLMELMGGNKKFIEKLDELFTTDSKLAGREQPDITGLIGQYAHGNEPSHHIAYLYAYAGAPWKTQKIVRQIMDEFYKPTPDGLIGNEDCGQMSAWYILSASGFYPVSPGKPTYAFGTPIFKEVKYNLENGKTFTIKAPNVSTKNFFIRSAKLNGTEYKKAFVSHKDIANGGVLEFEMSDKPEQAAFSEFPISSAGSGSVAVPLIDGGSRVFKEQTAVAIRTTTPDSKIYYTTDGSSPTEKSKLYTNPFSIGETSTVKAVAESKSGQKSIAAEAIIHKKSNDWTVKIESIYNRQYTGGGDEGLIDGIRGTVNFASGEWQGYQPQDFVAVIDLQRVMEINKVGGGFLQVARSWIWMPTRIEFEVSSDNMNFTKIANIKTDVAPDDMVNTIRDYYQNIAPLKARYVRVKAYNLGKIPAWHPGAGFDSFIFVDEIFIDVRQAA